MNDSTDLGETAARVLLAIHREERASSRGTELPLRRIAATVLDNDDEGSARVLRELDLRGALRTDVMGWRRGWLTDAGRALAERLESSSRP